MTELTIEQVAQAARERRTQDASKRESQAAANRAWVAANMPKFSTLFASLSKFRMPDGDPPFDPKVVKLEKFA